MVFLWSNIIETLIFCHFMNLFNNILAKKLQESTGSPVILFLWRGARKGRYILQQSHFPVPLLHLMDFSMDRDKRGWFWSEVSFRRTRCQIPASAWIWWNLMMMIIVTINDGDHSDETVTKVLAILGNVTFFPTLETNFGLVLALMELDELFCLRWFFSG